MNCSNAAVSEEERCDAIGAGFTGVAERFCDTEERAQLSPPARELFSSIFDSRKPNSWGSVGID